MFALGLQGSPRLKGNTNHLLSAFMKEMETYRVETKTIQVCKQNIQPCKELIVCEKKGYCPIKDDMEEIFGLIRRADFIILASPVFFYSITAQLKSMVDRCQMFWGRKYRLGLKDPGSDKRQGFVLSVGASRGKDLFKGTRLIADYFFDAVSAHYNGSLTYRNIEHKNDMANHLTMAKDISVAVHTLCSSHTPRKKILFISRENACRSQMAGAFTQIHGGHDAEVFTAGISPGKKIDDTMVSVMEEKKIDMKYRTPQHLESVHKKHEFDIIVTLSSKENAPDASGIEQVFWKLKKPEKELTGDYRKARDHIESKVKSLLTGL